MKGPESGAFPLHPSSPRDLPGFLPRDPRLADIRPPASIPVQEQLPAGVRAPGREREIRAGGVRRRRAAPPAGAAPVAAPTGHRPGPPAAALPGEPPEALLPRAGRRVIEKTETGEIKGVGGGGGDGSGGAIRAAGLLGVEGVGLGGGGIDAEGLELEGLPGVELEGARLHGVPRIHCPRRHRRRQSGILSRFSPGRGEIGVGFGEGCSECDEIKGEIGVGS